MLRPLLPRAVWWCAAILCILNSFGAGSKQQKDSNFAASVDGENVLTVDEKELTNDIKLEELDSRTSLQGRRRRRSRRRRYEKQMAIQLADAAIAALKTSSRTEGLLPLCLKNGDGDVAYCVQEELSSKADWIQQRASALQKGLDIFGNCPNYASLGDVLKLLAKDIECTSKMAITYPTGIDTNWEPKVLTTSQNICTGIGGLNFNTLKGLIAPFTQCAKGMYDAVAEGINEAKEILLGCECQANFGIYFGASVGVSAVVSGSMATGLIVGCDGCHFKYKSWWSFFGGVTTNIAADVGLMLGFASTWDSFWGRGQVYEASAGPLVVAGGVGVGTSFPELFIETSTHTVKKKFCYSVLGCYTAEKSLSGVPDNIVFVLPEFESVDFAITAGIGLSPVDMSTGSSTCYAID